MMHIEKFPEGEGDAEGAADRMLEFFGPSQVDFTVRQAIHFCWLGLPKDRKNVEGLEQLFRHIVERALKDFREDSEAFCRAQ